MIFFRNNAIPPSWRLKLPESWGESKTDFKGEVDGSLLFFAFQDRDRDQRTLRVSVKKWMLCRLDRTCQPKVLGFKIIHLPDAQPVEQYAPYIPCNGKTKPATPKTLFAVHLLASKRY